MTTGYETGPLIPTRFGDVATLPAIANRTEAQQHVLVGASLQGLRAAGWLMDLADHQSDPETGSVLLGMAEAAAVTLMAFNSILLELEEHQEDELLRLLDLHAGPAGSLLSQRVGVRMDPADLTAVAALGTALRAAVSMASMWWERDLPNVLSLVDHILDQAGAERT